MNAIFDIQTITLIVTVIVAFSGYLITHRSELSRARRAERLELIDRRINEFYGPLYIVIQDSYISYMTLLNKHNKTSSFLERDKQPTEQELLDWRIWMTNVFMPLNLHVEKLVLENAYLIREEKIPECLIQFLTHVSAYKAILKKWETGDYSELISVNDFPRELGEYATSSYQELKQEQLRLIGQI
jgi:hypothetical protein